MASKQEKRAPSIEGLLRRWEKSVFKWLVSDRFPRYNRRTKSIHTRSSSNPVDSRRLTSEPATTPAGKIKCVVRETVGGEGGSMDSEVWRVVLWVVLHFSSFFSMHATRSERWRARRRACNGWAGNRTVLCGRCIWGPAPPPSTAIKPTLSLACHFSIIYNIQFGRT